MTLTVICGFLNFSSVFVHANYSSNTVVCYYNDVNYVTAPHVWTPLYSFRCFYIVSQKKEQLRRAPAVSHS